MRNLIANIPERPAFMKLVHFEQQENNEGYTLQLDPENPPASIINLNKRRRVSMIKTEVKALEGFENIFDELMAKKTSLDEEKQVAIQAAIAQVEERFVETAGRIDRAIEQVSVTEEIEVPDEELTEEVSEEVAPETVDGTITY